MKWPRFQEKDQIFWWMWCLGSACVAAERSGPRGCVRWAKCPPNPSQNLCVRAWRILSWKGIGSEKFVLWCQFFFPPVCLFITSYDRRENTVGRRTAAISWTQFLPPPAFFSLFCIFSTHFLAGYIRGRVCGFFFIFFLNNIWRKLEKGNLTIERGKLLKNFMCSGNW